MPYIEQKERDKFIDMIQQFKLMTLDKNYNFTPGDLNYLISVLCRIYIDHKGEKYQYYNDLLGVLEGVKLELYRQQVSKYEDKKILKNGDI